MCAGGSGNGFGGGGGGGRRISYKFSHARSNDDQVDLCGENVCLSRQPQLLMILVEDWI
jgi:hypothetical protein